MILDAFADKLVKPSASHDLALLTNLSSLGTVLRLFLPPSSLLQAANYESKSLHMTGADLGKLVSTAVNDLNYSHPL